MTVQCFVYTNGRSTFNYCIQSLQSQIRADPSDALDFSGNIKVFRNKTLQQALNKTLSKCSGTHFIKVDDDFVLHPKAISYMLSCVRNSKAHKYGVYSWHLWETWTSKIVSGIKLYSVDALREIGGFEFDEFAKTDKLTNARLQEAGYKLYKNPSIVGLHVCGSWDEQLRYEELWNASAEVEYKKSTHLQMKNYSVPLDEQVSSLKAILERVNKKRKNEFYQWLKEGSGIKIRRNVGRGK